MKKSIVIACLLLFVPEGAMAGSTITLNGNRGATTKNVSHKTIINNGNIAGGSETGLTVNGSGNQVVNNGAISGTTGVKITGGSSSLVNNCTISATSKGASRAVAVGISQGN